LSLFSSLNTFVGASSFLRLLALLLGLFSCRLLCLLLLGFARFLAAELLTPLLLFLGLDLAEEIASGANLVADR
jgi:hypothetical protein